MLGRVRNDVGKVEPHGTLLFECLLAEAFGEAVRKVGGTVHMYRLVDSGFFPLPTLRRKIATQIATDAICVAIHIARAMYGAM